MSFQVIIEIYDLSIESFYGSYSTFRTLKIVPKIFITFLVLEIFYQMNFYKKLWL